VAHRAKDGTLTTIGTAQGLERCRVGSASNPQPAISTWDVRARIDILRGGRVAGHLTAADGLPSNDVQSVYFDRNGRLLVGTVGGGFARRRVDGTFEVFGTRAGLPSGRINTFAEDREGTLWVATAGGGLNALHAGKVEVLTSRHGLSMDSIRSIYEDSAGLLWIGTNGGGLNRYDAATSRIDVFLERDGLCNEQVWSTVETPEGDLWIATYHGLGLLSKGRFTCITKEAGLPNEIVRSLFLARDGMLYAGTYGGGLARLRNGKVVDVLSTKTGFPSDVIFSMREAGDGGMWVATEGGGLVKVRPDGTFTQIGTRQGLSHDVARAPRRRRHALGGTHGGAEPHRGRSRHASRHRSGPPDDVVHQILLTPPAICG
jgi:ligand-binding sensor domain-containing protein